MSEIFMMSENRVMPEPRAETLLGSRVVRVFTTKMVCCNCRRAFVIPKGGELECGDCENCGNTSYHTEDGRPWGRRHSCWVSWVRSIYRLTDEDRITQSTLDCFYEIREIGEYLGIAADTKAAPGSAGRGCRANRGLPHQRFSYEV